MPFFKHVDAAPDGGLFVLRANGRVLKTPDGSPLAAPSRALADAVAAEWRAVEKKSDIAGLALTKLLSTCIDRIAPQRDVVANGLMAYGDSDVLRYRAGFPADLSARQAAQWDRWLDWTFREYGARLSIVTGIVTPASDPDAAATLSESVLALDDVALTAVSAAAPILGSLVLALALERNAADAVTLFGISHLDEDFQAGKWGRDAEAASRRQSLENEVSTIARFLALARA